MMRSQERIVNRTLKRTYPDCRIRWSGRDQNWRLERKANYKRIDINPTQYPAHAVDTFTMRRDGYYLVGTYEPRHWLIQHPDMLVKVLLANDTTRMDIPGKDEVERAANYAKSLEETEIAEKANFARSQSFYETGLGGELYDELAWAEGRRVAVP